MSNDKLHELQLHAFCRVQELGEADGIRSMLNKKVFMDELSGEDDFAVYSGRDPIFFLAGLEFKRH